ncbi:MAG: helix-turn-helix transcriptional regulator [Pedobacter sp.]|nr:helix-turn-helix transcriptional regulator [Pedobacter sp.]MDQ8053499.1 helix-turn-helix transcriptional regulator [Pedobacter sp.]
MENIGQKIKKIRELKNYSRHYVAGQLEISITTYGKIERGEIDFTVGRLSHIAKILDIPMSAIIDFDESILFKKI